MPLVLRVAAVKGIVHECGVWLELQVTEAFQAISCPSWLGVVLAELGSRAQSDHTVFVCPLWPLTAASPIDPQ